MKQTIDEQVDRIINQEIWCCDSYLIDALMGQYPQSDIANQFYIDNIENQYTTNEELLEDFQYSDAINYEQHIEQSRDNGEDIKEVFEWYRVSDWLAEKLDSINEPLLRNDYGNWWGRTCTGQHIKLDGTIQQIVKNMNHDYEELVKNLDSK